MRKNVKKKSTNEEENKLPTHLRNDNDNAHRSTILREHKGNSPKAHKHSQCQQKSLVTCVNRHRLFKYVSTVVQLQVSVLVGVSSVKVTSDKRCVLTNQSSTQDSNEQGRQSSSHRSAHNLVWSGIGNVPGLGIRKKPLGEQTKRRKRKEKKKEVNRKSTLTYHTDCQLGSL